MKKITLFLVTVFAMLLVNAQDYFEDAQGNGFPILTHTNGSNFNARINTKDNSIKVNFFKFFKPQTLYGAANSQFKDEDVVGPGTILPRSNQKIKLPDAIDSWGWGLSLKGKTEQNLGSIFSEGVFSPGFTGGIYFANRSIKDPGTKPKINNWLISAQYTASSLRLFDTSLVFDKMKIDSAFNGVSFSIAYFQVRSLKKADNLIWGASVEYAQKNNYSTLDKYEVKDFEKQVIDPLTGNVRTIQIADDDGYGYSINKYVEKKYLTLRPHINYIPKFLNYRVGMIFYPSYVIVEDSEPRTNFELAFHLLEKGIPSLSNFSIYFTLTDVANNREVKDKTFIQRSFSVGIGASFNMFTGKQN